MRDALTPRVCPFAAFLDESSIPLAGNYLLRLEWL